MLNNVQKVALALTLSCLSDDMSVNIIRVPKFHNKFAMTLTSKDGSFSQTVPMEDTNSIERFFRDVVNYFYKKVTTTDIPFRASQEDIIRDAEVLLSGVFLATTGSDEDKDRIEKTSDCVEFVDDCIKYVNQGSREHQLLLCTSNFLNEIFFHISLEEMKEDGEFNLKETLDDCYAFAEVESKDNKRKWRRRPETQVDKYLDMEVARILTYAILAKNVNFDICNVLQADNTLKVEFDAGDCLARPYGYIHNKQTKYVGFKILKNEIFKSILGNNCIQEYMDMSEGECEKLCLDIIRDNGIDGLALQRFLGFYFKNGLSEVNYGRDSQLIDTILLNISSVLGIGFGNKISVEDDNLLLAEVCDIFDDNYNLAGENRKTAISSALAIDDYISDLYK